MEAPGGGKKGHRRHRSISSMLLPGWRRKGSASGAAGGCLQSLSFLCVGVYTLLGVPVLSFGGGCHFIVADG
jgi:hypothetical protein